MKPNQDDLDPPPAEMADLLERVGRRTIDFLSSIGEQPAASFERPPPALLAALREPLPANGRPLDDVLDFLFSRVLPFSYNTAGPGYLAYIPGGGLYSAAVAEYVAAAVNRYAGVWAAAPAAVELETQALRWLAEFLGCAPGTLGVFTTGGSLSNLLAFVAARDKLLGGNLFRGTVYVSDEVHHSVTKAARIAGVPEENIRRLAVDGEFKMRVDLLEERVALDRENGLEPFLVCGTAGTINTGAVDRLDEIAAVARRERLWFHVDGAYGGVFRCVEELAPVFRGMEEADSIAVDPHKGLFLAYGTGVLLVKDLGDLHRAFHGGASYLPRFQDQVEHIDFCEVSPELSRDWRGLRLWLPFRLHGSDAFRRAIGEKRELAVRMWKRLCEEPDVEIAAPPELSLFAFRRRVPGASLDDENRRNRELLERINRAGAIFLTGTEIAGTFYLRVVVLHMRTRADRVEAGLEIILEALREGRGRERV